MTTWRNVLVVHAGALGDSVLLWPLLRALARPGGDAVSVVFAARHSHARLAARCIDEPGLVPADADAPALIRLWAGDAEPAAESLDAVLTFLADEKTPAGRRWLNAAAVRWPGAEILSVGPPASTSRDATWARAQVPSRGRAPQRINADGPVVLHVGAGSPAKRWPLERFLALADELLEHVAGEVRLIAGEVEGERFTPSERADFAGAHGQVLADLDGLAAQLGEASLVIGNDSGPAHLSAQLGVPTLALFGPTDPAVWSPVGPHVRVLAPSEPGPIGGIPVDAVLDAAADALALSRFHRAASDRAIITRLP